MLEDMLAVCCRVLQCGVRYSALFVAVSRVCSVLKVWKCQVPRVLTHACIGT